MASIFLSCLVQIYHEHFVYYGKLINLELIKITLKCQNFSMDILNTYQKFVHIFNLLRCFPKHIFYYLCEENAMISDFFGFINKNMQTILLLKV